jgi:hypothetical protein
MDNFLIVSYFVLAVCLGHGFYRLITKNNKQNNINNISLFNKR